MKAIDAIRIGLKLTDLDLHFFEDMRHAPLTQPMPYGGNHPWWLIGHLTWAEGNVVKIIRGVPNPAERWSQLFMWGTEPALDASTYPPFDELIRTYRELRKQNLALLDEIADAGLDTPTKNPPPGLEKQFGTAGQVFATIAFHQNYHFGQASVTWRAAGKQPSFVPSEALRKW
jgi:hypothetical protein